MSRQDLHDRQFERLLERARGTRGDTTASADCLDADAFAAWTDGTLAPAERIAAEAHASGCSRCQAVLAAMADSAPASAAARPWWRRRVVTWLVPLTAAATALVIWIAVPRRDGPAPSPVAGPAVAGVPRDATAPEPAAVTSTRPDAAAQPQIRAFGLDARSAAEASRSAAAKENQAPAVAARHDDAASLAKEKKLEDRARREMDALASAPPPPAAAATPAPPPAPAMVQPPVSTAEQVQQAPRPSPSQTPQQSAGISAGRAVTLEIAAAAQKAARDVIEIVSPDPSVRWRLVASGNQTIVQYTSDAGVTWAPQPIQAAPAVLTAGAAPQRDVCWLVGQGGAVFVTADARTWRRVALPERIDLTGVIATDARTATVTTIDGRRFTTADAGVTWTPTSG